MKLEEYLEQLTRYPEIIATSFFGAFIDQEQQHKFKKAYSTLRIRSESSRRNSIYWVKGMKLQAMKDYTAASPEEISFSKGDILNFMGDKDIATERIKVEMRESIGWVPVDTVQVLPHLGADDWKVRRNQSQDPVVIPPSSPPTIGLYR
jgi:hypothetical protein